MFIIKQDLNANLLVFLKIMLFYFEPKLKLKKKYCC